MDKQISYDDDYTALEPKDFRLIIRVKNNRILKAIEDAGYPNVCSFCKANSLSAQKVGEYVNLKRTPLTRNGAWKMVPINIADALSLDPEDLWSDIQQTSVIKKAIFSIEIEESVALGYTKETPTPEQLLCEREEFCNVQAVIGHLSKNERIVINRRFGFNAPDNKGETLESIAKDMGLTRERIRQIEKNALERLGKSEKLQEIRDV